MTNPAPSEGEEPMDEQSETVSAPQGDESPPVRTKRTGAVVGLLLLLWIGLGVALVVVTVMVI